MKKYLLIFTLALECGLMAKVPYITVYIHGSQNSTKFLSKDIWYCPKGLHSISKLPDSSCLKKDAQILCKNNSQLFDIDHYYTFGWSGKISFKKREIAGHDLFIELQ